MVKVQRLFAKTNLKVPVCRTYRTITQKCLQLELPTENSVYSQENRNRAGNYAHLTSENGKLAAFASGRPAFQQHVKRAEGSDTTHASHTRKTMIAGCTNPDFDKSEKDHAAQRGRDARAFLLDAEHRQEDHRLRFQVIQVATDGADSAGQSKG